jgi:uncharacterized membrane protein
MVNGARSKPRWRNRRGSAVVATCALAVGTLLALASPAGAQSAVSEAATTMVLSNAVNGINYGSFASSGVTVNSQVDVDQSPGRWEAFDFGTWTGGSPSVTGADVQFRAVTTSGIVSDLCLANTNDEALPALQPCGDNGTYWVVVRSGNGYYLYGRFWLDQGADLALGVDEPQNYAYTEIVLPSLLKSGDGIYARWNVTI